jgi:uncharacterized protein (UPF0218 family)
VLILTDELRAILKKPMGQLFPNFEDAIKLIKKAKFFISVGDETTINLFNNDLIPNLAIIDNSIQRKKHNIKIHNYTTNIFNVDNPSGTITDQLWETIGIAIKKSTDESQLIIINGEEDLAVLPAVLLAPENGIILYGQPNEGLVLLKVSDIKEKVENYIKMFKTIKN